MFARFQSPTDVSQNKFKSEQKMLITSNGLSLKALLCSKHNIYLLCLKKEKKHISFWNVKMSQNQICVFVFSDKHDKFIKA
jgi:hypothetical protein